MGLIEFSRMLAKTPVEQVVALNSSISPRSNLWERFRVVDDKTQGITPILLFDQLMCSSTSQSDRKVISLSARKYFQAHPVDGQSHIPDLFPTGPCPRPCVEELSPTLANLQFACHLILTDCVGFIKLQNWKNAFIRNTKYLEVIYERLNVVRDPAVPGCGQLELLNSTEEGLAFLLRYSYRKESRNQDTIIGLPSHDPDQFIPYFNHPNEEVRHNSRVFFVKAHAKKNTRDLNDLSLILKEYLVKCSDVPCFLELGHSYTPTFLVVPSRIAKLIEELGSGEQNLSTKQLKEVCNRLAPELDPEQQLHHYDLQLDRYQQCFEQMTHIIQNTPPNRKRLALQGRAIYREFPTATCLGSERPTLPSHDELCESLLKQTIKFSEQPLRFPPENKLPEMLVEVPLPPAPESPLLRHLKGLEDPNQFPFPLAHHVYRWFENPDAVLNSDEYAATAPKYHPWVIAQHTFNPLVAHLINTPYAYKRAWKSPTTGQVNTLYCIPGIIEMDGVSNRGCFEICLDQKTGECYHYCFSKRTKDEFFRDFCEQKLWDHIDFPAIERAREVEEKPIPVPLSKLDKGQVEIGPMEMIIITSGNIKLKVFRVNSSPDSSSPPRSPQLSSPNQSSPSYADKVAGRKSPLS
ncbi:MAG: hypothetical protein S4CHLAM102_03410 [Chlamydiia bacterium]|nr:hypothetical protein [Chlamydiia bacterium]